MQNLQGQKRKNVEPETQDTKRPRLGNEENILGNPTSSLIQNFSNSLNELQQTQANGFQRQSLVPTNYPSYYSSLRQSPVYRNQTCATHPHEITNFQTNPIPYHTSFPPNHTPFLGLFAQAQPANILTNPAYFLPKISSFIASSQPTKMVTNRDFILPYPALQELLELYSKLENKPQFIQKNWKEEQENKPKEVEQQVPHNYPKKRAGKKKELLMATEQKIQFCEWIKQGNCDKLQAKFHSFLKTESHAEIREYGIHLAAVHGYRAIVNYLLGPQLRLYGDDFIGYNSAAALDREILLIKRSQEYVIKFKDNKGSYAEKVLTYASNWNIIQVAVGQNFNGSLCNNINLTNEIINLISATTCYLPQFEISLDKKQQILTHILNGKQFSLFLNLLEIFASSLGIDFDKSGSYESNFINVLRWVYIFSARFGYKDFLVNLLTAHSNKLTEACHIIALKAAVRNNQRVIVDFLLGSFPWTDADIDSLFWFAFRIDAHPMQEYLLSKEKNYYYSIASKEHSYSIFVITDKNIINEQLKYNISIKFGQALLLIVTENKYILGFSSAHGYKEEELKNLNDLHFIQDLLLNNPNKQRIYTLGNDTRRLRQLLISLGANIFTQCDPEKLTNLIGDIHYHLYQDYGRFCDKGLVLYAQEFARNSLYTIEVFLKNDYFNAPMLRNEILLRVGCLATKSYSPHGYSLLKCLIKNPHFNPERNESDGPILQIIKFAIKKFVEYDNLAFLNLVLKYDSYDIKNICKDNQTLNSALEVAVKNKKYVIVEQVIQAVYPSKQSKNVLQVLAANKNKELCDFFINAEGDFSTYLIHAFMTIENTEQLKDLLSLNISKNALDEIITKMAQLGKISWVKEIFQDSRCVIKKSLNEWNKFFLKYNIVIDNDTLEKASKLTDAWTTFSMFKLIVANGFFSRENFHNDGISEIETKLTNVLRNQL